MSSVNDIERAIARLNLTTKAGTDKRILDDSYVALGKAVHKQRQTAESGIWRKITRSRFAVPAAVAAIILLAFSLFTNSRNDIVNVEKIYVALNRVENINVSTFQAGQTRPDQQVWTSKTLGVKLIQSGFGDRAQYTLWDMKNQVKMVKFLSSNSIRTEPITEIMLSELEKSIADSNDMVPFSNRDDIPAEARWIRIDGEEISSVPGTKAYELSWTEKSTVSQAILYRKWRVFAEDRAGLPKRIEWYSKTRPEDDYGFEKYVVIAYPSEDEIRNIIRDIFGRKDNPEYIPTPEAYR